MNISEKILKTGVIIFGFFACISISGITAGIIISFTGLLMLVILKGKLIPQNKLTETISLLIVIFLISVFISNLISGMNISTANRYMVFSGELLVFFIGINLKSENRNNFINLFFVILIISCITQSIIVIIEYISGTKFFTLLNREALTSIRRASGTLGHPNSVAGVIAMVIPLLITFTFYHFIEKNKISYLYLLFTVLAVICLILTFSRSAWLGLVSGISLIALVLNRKIFIIILIMIGIFTITPGPRERILNTFRKKNTERILIWKSSFELIKKKPIFGWGQDTFQNIFYTKYLTKKDIKYATYKNYGRVNDEPWTHFHSHSIYLGLLQETGISGFFIFCLIVIFLFCHIYFILKNETDNFTRIITAGIAGMFTEFLIHGIFDYTLRGETAYLFWFFAGLIFSL